MGEEVKALAKADSPLGYSQLRFDLRRDTRIMATRNVAGHLHVTFGGDQVTMIIHPHAARRLIADMQAVLDGQEFAHD